MSSRRESLAALECDAHPSRMRLACPDCFALRVDDGTHAARLAVIAAARELLGRPFQHRQRSVGGIDCSGVLVLSFRAAGLRVRDLHEYSRGISGSDFVAAFRERAVEVLPADAGLPADFVLLKIGSQVEHSAILTERGTLIHASAREGEVVERTLEPLWRSRVAFVFRMPEFSRG